METGIQAVRIRYAHGIHTAVVLHRTRILTERASGRNVQHLKPMPAG